MGRDSNPRYLAVHTLSRRAQSTTLAPILEKGGNCSERVLVATVFESSNWLWTNVGEPWKAPVPSAPSLEYDKGV
jgi:hypothetical protein